MAWREGVPVLRVNKIVLFGWQECLILSYGLSRYFFFFFNFLHENICCGFSIEAPQ